jgi:uncharacterized protein YggE
MKPGQWTRKAAAIAALVSVVILTAACQFEGGPGGDQTRISAAGMSAGNAALVGIAQGAQQRTSPALTTDAQGEIHITGKGKVSIEPDLAILNMGIETMGATVAEAREEAASAMNSVLEVIKAAGIEEKDIQTRHFDIRPEYQWQEVTENGIRRSKSVLVGYRVSNDLVVKVRDLDNVGTVIDDAAEAGEDTIRFNGLQFTAEDLSPVMEELREEAFSDAKSKARHFADLAEVGLGDLIFISDGAVASPQSRGYPETLAFGAAKAYDESTSISPGELDVSLSIQTIFTIQ